MREITGSTIFGILSDNDIKTFWGKGINIFTSEKGNLAFSLEKQLQLGSIDLRFRHEYKKIKLQANEILTYDMLKKHDYTKPYELQAGEKLVIAPGEMVLTTTLETIQLSEEFAGIITGRSSIARLGIMVHCCQEYINPGHGQPIPLQLINLAPCSVELDLNIPICQLVLFRLHTPATDRYKDSKKSKYANEVGPQNSKIYEEDANHLKEQKGKKVLPADVRTFLNKYIAPFLPTIISILIITPFISNYINNRSFFDVATAFQELPFSLVLGVIALLVFIWLKRGNRE